MLRGRRGPYGTRRPREKTCKQCRTRYMPAENARPFENWCSPECGALRARAAQMKAQERRRQKEARELKARKKALKTPQQVRSEAMQKAQSAVCRYVRVRDEHDPCISCGASVLEVESGPYRTGGYWDGGHYQGKGAHPEIRLNTWNIHKQCKICNGGENRYRSGSKRTTVGRGYRAGLIAKIGLERVEWLEGQHPPLKAEPEYLERFARVFNKRARHLKKLRGEA